MRKVIFIATIVKSMTIMQVNVEEIRKIKRVMQTCRRQSDVNGHSKRKRKI